jgi:predicted RNase H-like HicB family nuclease
MKKYYRTRIYQYPNGDSFDWVVEYPDLPGCIGVGDTVKKAIVEAEINKELWLEAAKEIGKEIPLPTCSRRLPSKIQKI